MVTILSPCSSANISRSGILAMVPSSFMISQMTPAGLSPARRARSTEPSVWPALTSTPPSRALKGKTWPGVAISSGVQSSFMTVSMVVALSWAEMPVVTPRRASMDTVNAVPNRLVFFDAIMGRPSLSTMEPSRARQMSPLPYFAMKFMASGVTFSAAMHRSPSFSLSSSSTRMTILPSFMSCIASSMVETGILLHLPVFFMYF